MCREQEYREIEKLEELIRKYSIPEHVTEWDYLRFELLRIKARNPHFHPDCLPEKIRIGKD